MKPLGLLFSLRKRNPSLFTPKPAAVYSSSAANTKYSDSLSDEEGSKVYQQKLKSQRPTVIKWKKNLGNSASFIGSVLSPLRVANTGHANHFGVYTLLRVRNSPQSTTNFCIILNMWDEMAVLSFKHLQPNDFIYVSGYLRSKTKVDEKGKVTLYHLLAVKELNYVAQRGQEPSFKNQLEPPQAHAGETGFEKLKDRLDLWQVFFANPYDWWDNRNLKGNTRRADFKHKDTGETLCLSPDDPPWVKRQLQLLDLASAEQGEQICHRSRPRISEWEYNEYE